MSAQTYATHAHRPVFTLVAAAFWVVAVFGFGAGWVGYAWGATVGLAALLPTVLCLISMSRAYTTKLQDRIILLEERLRAERLLSASQLARWGSLSVKQVVALRFASDAEFAVLFERALTEQLRPDAIKRAVATRRPDLHRT